MGKPDPNKNRPIKLRMNTESEMEKVMSRLPNLKNAEDHFRKISVTDDYTVERHEITKWVEKAKRKIGTIMVNLSGKLEVLQKTECT